MLQQLLTNLRRNLTHGAVASTSVISAALGLTVAAAIGVLDAPADMPVGLAGGLALAVLFLLPPK